MFEEMSFLEKVGHMRYLASMLLQEAEGIGPDVAQGARVVEDRIDFLHRYAEQRLGR